MTTHHQLTIGIVLPVFNEAKILEEALEGLARITGGCEVVVVDGGSVDGSASVAGRYFRTEMIGEANRGAQMNHGGSRLSSDVLLFLHVDSRLPPGFASCIQEALADPNVVGGCFRLRFDDSHPMLRFYSWLTRYPGRYFHFGDQGFFVRREVFEEMGGYRHLLFLEDVEFLRRLLRYGRFSVLPVPVVTSARRFLRRGIVLQQFLNIVVVMLFELGVPPHRLTRFYPHIR